MAFASKLPRACAARPVLPLRLAIGLGVAVLAGACSGSSGTKGGGGAAVPTETARVSIEFADGAPALAVRAGVPQRASYTFVLPDDGVTAATVDLGASLALVDVTPEAPLTLANFVRLVTAVAQGNGEIGVSRALPPGTTCDASIGLRRFEIGLSALFQPTGATPGTNEVTASGVEAVRAGPFMFCVEVLSPVDASIALRGVVADVTRSACAEAPASFAGSWTGTYSCTYSCGSGFGGEIDLEVTQTGDQATYVDDGGAAFTGRVCGSTFRFARNTLGETERGTFTLQPDGTAIKTSTYWGTFDGCTGTCTDVLRRP